MFSHLNSIKNHYTPFDYHLSLLLRYYMIFVSLDIQWILINKISIKGELGHLPSNLNYLPWFKTGGQSTKDLMVRWWPAKRSSIVVFLCQKRNNQLCSVGEEQKPQLSNILEHYKTSWYIIKHLGTLSNILEHYHTSWNIIIHLEHYQTSWNIINHLGTLSTILEHYQTYWDITKHCGTLSEILGHYRRFWDTIEDFWNTIKHFGTL